MARGRWGICTCGSDELSQASTAVKALLRRLAGRPGQQCVCVCVCVVAMACVCMGDYVGVGVGASGGGAGGGGGGGGGGASGGGGGGGGDGGGGGACGGDVGDTVRKEGCWFLSLPRRWYD
eukprot:28338-Chlamydomonas_euryale.AAC.1